MAIVSFEKKSNGREKVLRHCTQTDCDSLNLCFGTFPVASHNYIFVREINNNRSVEAHVGCGNPIFKERKPTERCGRKEINNQ
jgi:hypothetical protein